MTAHRPSTGLAIVGSALGTDRALQPGAVHGARKQAILTGSLILGDGLAIACAFALAYLLRFKTGIELFYVPSDSPRQFYSSLVFWLVPLVLVTLAAYGLYRPDLLFSGTDEYQRIWSATTFAMILVIFVSFLFDTRLVISRAWLILSWALLLTCLGTERFAVRRVVYRLRRAGKLASRVLILGAGEDAAELANWLRATPTSGLAVAGVFDPRHLYNAALAERQSDEPPGLPPTVLRRLIADLDAGAAIVCAASVAQETLDTIVRELAGLPTELHLVPGMREVLTTGVRVRDIHGLPLVTMNKARITGIDRALKQALDYVGAALVLIGLAPLLLALAVLIRVDSPGAALHRRRVVGQGGRRFDALKFRTMHINGEAILARHAGLREQLEREGKLDDDPRVTRVGRWLRRSSLDELPQLVNVLRGQMSLVGPRMIAESELRHFGRWQENLFTVKPGLTGLWQVSGRSDLGYEARVRLDMHYIRSYTVWTDIEILWRTIPAVLLGVGAR